MATTTVQLDKADQITARAESVYARGGEMKERKEPRFVKFAEGECIKGILLGVERIAIKGERGSQQASRYTVHDHFNDETVAFLGTYDIDTKLKPGDVGRVVEIRFEGTDSSVTRNGNAMKRFKVLVSENRIRESQSEAVTTITDEDIPF